LHHRQQLFGHRRHFQCLARASVAHGPDLDVEFGNVPFLEGAGHAGTFAGQQPVVYSIAEEQAVDRLCQQEANSAVADAARRWSRRTHAKVEADKITRIDVAGLAGVFFQICRVTDIAEKHGWNKFVGLQYYFSLASRDIEREILPLATSENLAVMPWSPLAGGFLGGKYSRNAAKAEGTRRDTFDFPPIDKEKAYDIIDVIAEIGKQQSASVAEVALAWVRQQKGITSTIIGAKTVEQLNANIKSVDLQLSPDDLEKINKVSALPKEYPGWMVERQSGDRILK